MRGNTKTDTRTAPQDHPDWERLMEAARDLGVTEDTARDMVATHLARREERIPRYVIAALNAARDGVIACRKTQDYLTRTLGINETNAHSVGGHWVNWRWGVERWHVI